MVLKFDNGEYERVIAEVGTEEEAIRKIHEFCDERNYKICYMRILHEGDRKVYDVGSWSQFFYLYQ